MEIGKYLQFNFKKRTLKKIEGKDVITPEQRTLYKIVFKSILSI
jgi:hypothetical protein